MENVGEEPRAWQHILQRKARTADLAKGLYPHWLGGVVSLVKNTHTHMERALLHAPPARLAVRRHEGMCTGLRDPRLSRVAVGTLLERRDVVVSSTKVILSGCPDYPTCRPSAPIGSARYTKSVFVSFSSLRHAGWRVSLESLWTSLVLTI